MKIRRIALQEIRKFTQRMELTDLQPGLNIFGGANEAGKSTIAIALRSAFLVNHKTTTVTHLAPWGAAQPQPQVEVEFEISNDRYVLRKSFLSRKRCELLINDREKLDGEAAEEKLASLLRFSRAARGGGAPDHAGVPGLLWISQGQAHEVAAPVRHASSHLRDALGQLSGSRLEGGEDALIRRVKAMLHELVTERTRTPTGAYQKAIEALRDSSRIRDELLDQQRKFESDVARFEHVREEIRQRESRRLWEDNERKAVEAQLRLDQLEAAKKELDSRAAQLQAARDRIKLLQELERQAAARREELAGLQAQHLQARSDAEQAASALKETAAQLETARTNLAAARDALHLSMQGEQALQLRQNMASQTEQVDRLNTALASANIAKAKILAVQTRIAETTVDEALLTRLSQVEAERSTLAVRLDAAATRVEYRLEPGCSIQIDGRPVTVSGEVLVKEKTILEIPGIGTISVMLGATDLGDLARALNSLEAERSRLLTELNAASLAEAQQRRDANRQNRQELAVHRNELALYAPGGIETLEVDIQAAFRLLEETRQRLASVSEATEALSLGTAQAAMSEATGRVDLLQDHYQMLVTRRAETAAEERTLLERITAQGRMMDSDQWQAERSDHLAQLDSSRSEERMHVLAIEQASRNVEALSLQVSPDDPRRFSASAQLQRNEYERLKSDLNALAMLLDQQGAAGLGERLAEAEARIEQQTRRKNELQRRAEALMLLADMLVEERDKTVLALQAPLVSRMDYYFRRLFPGTSMTLDENLMLTAIQRSGQRASLDDLSFGTQEQLGILVRLAYADLLKECGVPVFLVLDDTCVHTDAVRRDQIKRTLLDAATRHQIIMLTCHPHDWSDLGLLPRPIEGLSNPLTI